MRVGGEGWEGGEGGRTFNNKYMGVNARIGFERKIEHGLVI